MLIRLNQLLCLDMCCHGYHYLWVQNKTRLYLVQNFLPVHKINYQFWILWPRGLSVFVPCMCFCKRVCYVKFHSWFLVNQLAWTIPKQLHGNNSKQPESRDLNSIGAQSISIIIGPTWGIEPGDCWMMNSRIISAEGIWRPTAESCCRSHPRQ